MIDEIIKIMKEMKLSDDCINKIIDNYNKADVNKKKKIYNFVNNLYESMKISKVNYD